MGSNAALHSTRPPVRGLLLLALATLAMSVAVTALRKPGRDGWLPLPPQPMDASDYDVRQLLSKSTQIVNPSQSAQGPRGLAWQCGREDAEPARPPPTAGRREPTTARAWTAEADPEPMPAGGDRYVLLLGSAGGSGAAQYLRIDIRGNQAQLRLSDGAHHRFPLHPAEARYPALRYTEQTRDLADLKALREAWNVAELWTAPQRSAVFCAEEYGAPQAFFEACVDGRYYARDRSCDRAAWPHLDQLRKAVRDAVSTPTSTAAPAARPS
ncbi:MAG: hypothetical protein ACREP7_18030 [Lysobacter sp.]